jgi:hypothetical protein
MDFSTSKPIVFAAFSKRNFFWRDHIVKFILEQGRVPVCAFVMFGYFLADTLPRNVLIEANNDLVRRADELWVFGEITDGVQAEIDLAHSLKRPMRFFRINPTENEIKEISEETASSDNSIA